MFLHFLCRSIIWKTKRKKIKFKDIIIIVLKLPTLQLTGTLNNTDFKILKLSIFYFIFPCVVKKNFKEKLFFV